MEISKEQVKKLYQMADSSGFRSAIMEMLPEAFEPEYAIKYGNGMSTLAIDFASKLSVVLGLESGDIDTLRTYDEKFDGRGLYLTGHFDWKMTAITEGQHKGAFYLIPYKK